MRELKINGFNELPMDEMMEVNGGARSKADRRAASKAARKNLTWAQARDCGRYIIPYACTLVSPLFSSTVGLAVSGFGYGVGYFL